jgi:hypothetical protein
MTRAEAIDRFKEARAGHKEFLSVETLNMAIEALEKETCGDAISRQAVNNLQRYRYNYGDTSITCISLKSVNELPPVNPQESKWIPVSKRLPKKSGEYWCTFGGTNLAGSDYYTTESDAKKIFDEPEEYVGWRSQNVVAWMPKPEPFKMSEIPTGSESEVRNEKETC